MAGAFLAVKNGAGWDAEPQDRPRYRASRADRVVLVYVAQKYGISLASMLGPSQFSEICQARHAAMFLLREVRRLSTTAIGDIFARDHTIPIYAQRKALKAMERYPEVLAWFERACDDLQSVTVGECQAPKLRERFFVPPEAA
jgi:hypothetical protein